MKKFSLFFITLLSIVFCFSSCNSCKKDQKQDDVKPVATLDVENTVSVDREHMFLTYGEDYRWYETSIVLEEFLDADSTSANIASVTNVFQVLKNKEEKSNDIFVVMMTHTPDTAVVEEKTGFWVEDFPLNNEDIKVTFKDAYDKVMATNSPKPHSRHCVLRKQVGPVPANPQYIFGNNKAQLYVDAVTGDVSDKNPAWPEEKGFKMPLGEWP